MCPRRRPHAVGQKGVRGSRHTQPLAQRLQPSEGPFFARHSGRRRFLGGFILYDVDDVVDGAADQLVPLRRRRESPAVVAAPGGPSSWAVSNRALTSLGHERLSGVPDTSNSRRSDTTPNRCRRSSPLKIEDISTRVALEFGDWPLRGQVLGDCEACGS